LQLYSCKENSKYTHTTFVNALDEFNEINRKLFDIPEIDRLLSFSSKKNVCVITKTTQSNAFLNSMVANACINYHTTNDTNHDNEKTRKNKTILVDAGNGNNLGHIYLNLVHKSLTYGFNIDEVLDQIIIVRAFTFYQLLNIIINEIPRLILKLDNCKIQIIVLDLLDTLFSPSHRVKTGDNNSYLRTQRDFKHNEKLVIEAIDCLINLSNNYFVILSYNDSNNMVDNFDLISKFSNVIEIDQLNSTGKKKRNKIYNEKTTTHQLLIKVKSNKQYKIMLARLLVLLRSPHNKTETRSPKASAFGRQR